MSPPTSLPTVEELRKIRSDLCKGLNNARYIGNPKGSILNGLEWVRVKTTDILVDAEGAEKFEAASKLHAEDPAVNPAPEPPQAALFSVAIRLSQKNFFWTSCGEYKGPTRFTKGLEDVKLTALGECPEVTVFGDDWRMVLKSWDEILGSKRTEGVHSIKGATDQGEGEPKRLKFRHALFEVRHTLLFNFHTADTIPITAVRR